MEFLDKLVLPLSYEHLQLLHYLLMLVLFMFIPFIGLIIGGTTLSVYFKSKGLNEGNENYLKYSKDIIDIVTLNKSAGIILGILAFFAGILILIQVLHTAGLGTINYLISSFILIVIGLILVYTYRYSLSFTNIFDSIKDVKFSDESLSGEVAKFREGNQSLGAKSGKYGLILLYIAMWIFTAAISLIIFTHKWGDRNFFYVLFSWEVLSKYIHFLAFSFAFAGAAVLFGTFYWEGGKKIIDEDYKYFVKSITVKIIFAASLIIPLLLIIDLFALPLNALSGSVFGFALIALLLLFWAYHLLYSMIKYSSVKLSGLLFFVLFFSILASITKDQLTVINSTQLQTEILSKHFDEYLAGLKSQAAGPVEINGEEIFQNICSSCHAFDHKVVGPPYQETMPKYEGKMNNLVAFILNPTQNNPGYPPMPNPGLKPNQAKAVAEYIMQTYQEKYKK